MSSNPAKATRARDLEQRLTVEGAQVYRIERHGSRFQAIVSHDEIARGDKRWHVSVSHTEERRRVTEAELIDICHAVRPGVIFCSPLPPRNMWVNIHAGVSHAWQIKDSALEAQWRDDGLAAQRAGHRGPDGLT